MSFASYIMINARHAVWGRHHASREAGIRAARRLLCDHKTCRASNPPNSLDVANSGRSMPLGVKYDGEEYATAQTVKNTLQRKMPGLPGKRH
jgi:hypothetical protein